VSHCQKRIIAKLNFFSVGRFYLLTTNVGGLRYLSLQENQWYLGDIRIITVVREIQQELHTTNRF
jgi:hypothetical protein